MVKDEQFAFARYGEDNTEVGVLSVMNFKTLFRERYKKQELPLFDVIISYSTLEHSGLGKD